MLQPFIYDCVVDTVPHNMEMGMIDISICCNATIFMYFIFADYLSAYIYSIAKVLQTSFHAV